MCALSSFSIALLSFGDKCSKSPLIDSRGDLGGSSFLDDLLSKQAAANSELVLKHYRSSYVMREQDPSAFSFTIGLHAELLV